MIDEYDLAICSQEKKEKKDLALHGLALDKIVL